MARTKSTFIIYCEYLPLRLFFSFLAAFPFTLAAKLSCGLIRFILLFIPSRRRLIKSNLAECFPSWTQRERNDVAHESLHKLGRGLALFSHIPQLAKKQFQTAVEVTGREH